MNIGIFNKLKVVLLMFVLLGSVNLVLPNAIVSAAPTDTKSLTCDGVKSISGEANCTDGGTKIEGVLKTVLNLLSAIVGIVAVIMIIIGGFKYITSSGDPSNIQSAKNTIMYAIVGIVIAALAQVIVRFVLKKATNT